ncbi:SusD-like starch-binding protein associating with outer membrane [Larkinella arboricola]|uniref:SusD-like starch-binding protein associating with outer membrane n=1 Tax=Larkinella arboricola TaxID=643671 RepID=A0A327XAL7_LARAB|nr:RagB/SusD family nutrient uptake outer membrane protein [Larkinella arboricola]RAK03154.1 SusD-like starch-binding protein associating with outer membrane [Larkinella arboricola]
MKFSFKHMVLLAGLTLSMPSCSFFEVEDTIDPNNPTLESILTNASRIQINQLGIGIQSALRNGRSNFVLVAGSIGREIYNLASTELTWTTELLGSTNGGFSATTLFNGYYADFSQTRRRAEFFKMAAENSAPGALTDAEKDGIRGFVNTVEAYTMLNMLNMQYKNGIRIKYTDLYSPGDLLKPGPFVSYEEGLKEIRRLLDEGATQLAAGGATFGFTMTSGYAGFNTPATFRKVNRALAARTAMYQQDWTGMLTLLNDSFLDLNGPMTTGPNFTYSTTSGDITNPQFQQMNTTASPVVAQSLFITEAEPGDTRVAKKVTKRSSVRAMNGIIGEYDVSLYPTSTLPISIIRNEELILMYAEAMMQTGKLAEAVTALDKVRVAAGLKELAVAKPTVVNNKAALIDELLNQRRYSLFYEGFRWFDMRRYGRLDQLPNDQPNHKVYEQLIRPFAEVQWDAKNPQ